jgi:cytoskeletal protein RodZ
LTNLFICLLEYSCVPFDTLVKFLYVEFIQNIAFLVFKFSATLSLAGAVAVTPTSAQLSSQLNQIASESATEPATEPATEVATTDTLATANTNENSSTSQPDTPVQMTSTATSADPPPEQPLTQAVTTETNVAASIPSQNEEPVPALPQPDAVLETSIG